MSEDYKAHPRRRQRQRNKGWRMSEGGVYVGRPTLWGNPFERATPFDSINNPVIAVTLFTRLVASKTLPTDLDHLEWPDIRKQILKALKRGELEGRLLYCWCPLDRPCHGDLLAALADQVAKR